MVVEEKWVGLLGNVVEMVVFGARRPFLRSWQMVVCF
jgi:hypothetical protein